VLRRCVWSRNIKNGCSIYIYIYIYDISSLKVNNPRRLDLVMWLNMTLVTEHVMYVHQCSCKAMLYYSWTNHIIFITQFLNLLVKKFPTFYATQKFITMFTTVLHCAKWIQSAPSKTSHLGPISILISSFQIRLSFPNAIQVVLPGSSTHCSCLSDVLWPDHLTY